MPAFEIYGNVLSYKVAVLVFVGVFIFQITEKAVETATQGPASEVPDTDPEGSPGADARLNSSQHHCHEDTDWSC